MMMMMNEKICIDYLAMHIREMCSAAIELEQAVERFPRVARPKVPKAPTLGKAPRIGALGWVKIVPCYTQVRLYPDPESEHYSVHITAWGHDQSHLYAQQLMVSCRTYRDVERWARTIQRVTRWYRERIAGVERERERILRSQDRLIERMQDEVALEAMAQETDHGW